MPIYVALANWTTKGLETIDDGPNRLDESKQLFAKYGAELKKFYLLLGGQPDVLAFFEAPDDHAAARVSIAIAARGTIRGTVHRVLNEEDYKDIVQNLK